MKLFISIEGQRCMETGLAYILKDIRSSLSFISCQSEEDEKYGREFINIAIIPTCVDEMTWCALGWKERVIIRRKVCEADVRLRINYEEFVEADNLGKRRMFVDVIVKSIKEIQKKSKHDFNGDALIADVLFGTGYNTKGRRDGSVVTLEDASDSHPTDPE